MTNNSTHITFCLSQDLCRNSSERSFRPLKKPQLALQAFAILPLILLNLGCYVAKLGYNQNNLMNSRQLISVVLADPSADKTTQARLQFVAEILEFAGKNGLNVSGAYRYYIQTDQPVVSYLLEAAYADRLESLTWWFPVVGRVPYRGYFSEAERDAAAAELAAQGYDTAKSGVGAFSSLGWFDDPIYSAMLMREDYSFAHLLFHELTHRTYWSPGSVRFNENLAEYVADFLTIQYFSTIKNEKMLEAYRQQQADLELYHAWLGRLNHELSDMYRRLQAKNLSEIKLEKDTIFAAYVKEKRPKFARFDFVGKEPWNNARVLGAGLYSPDLSAFRKAHLCNPSLNIGDFLARLRNIGEDDEDQFVALARLCPT